MFRRTILHAVQAAFLAAWCSLAVLPVTAQNIIGSGIYGDIRVGPPITTTDLNFAAGTVTGCASYATCLSITNSTGGYCTDSTGVLHNIAANTLRICSGTGVLIEQSSLNNIKQSQALATTPWAATGSSVLANNATAAPDGSTTATSVTDVVSSSTFGAGQNPITSTTGVFSAYVKAGSQSWAFIQLNSSSNAAAIYFQLTGSCTVGSIQTLSGTAPISSGTCQALANGWYRITVVGNAGIFFIGPCAANNNRVYTGTGAIAQYLWGIQGEPTLTMSTSYIPTTTSAGVSRSADNIVASGVLASELAGATGTIVANTNSSLASVAATLVDANGTVLLGKTSGNLGTTAVGATLSTGNTGTWTGANDLGLAWDATGGAIQLNAGTIVTDIIPRVPLPTFHLGSTSGSSAFFNGYFTRLTSYTTKQASPQ